MRIGSLFSGYGGLEQGVQSVLGGTVAWHSEIDPGACKILAHRYPDIPNLGDITAVDWADVEPVDVLTGGFPCQDVSAAGKRAGIRPDTRSGLWTQFAYAIDQLRPSLVVIENVRGLLSAAAEHPAHGDLEPCPWCLGDDEPVLLRALGAVLGDLADIGYDAAWHGLRAADVGAPHGRFRVFVVAWPTADAAELGRWTARRDDWVRAARLVSEPADADLAGLEGAEPAAGRLLPDGRSAPHAEVVNRWAGCDGGSTERQQGNDEPRGGTAAHPEGHGRHEGWSEPARLIGGSDAALCGDDTPAYAHGDALRQQSVRELRCGGPAVAGLAGAEVDADTAGLGRAGCEQSWQDVEQDRPEPAHAGAPRRTPIAWGDYEPAIRRWERRLGRPAPQPTQRGKNGQPRLSPAFVEWLMGLPAGWVTAVPGLTRNEQLKALGNGVVPQQAAAALRLLLPAIEAAA